MTHTPRLLPVATLAAALVLTLPAIGQSSSLSQNIIGTDPAGGGSQTLLTARETAPQRPFTPFSRIAVGGGVSPLGVNFTIAADLNRYLNLRTSGNMFRYSDDGISTNGFNVDAKLSLASAGLSLDVYPFPRHGFRISPGVLLYNGNHASAAFSVQGGTSFSLNDYTYYASSTDPVQGSGGVGLNSRKQAFTITTGWGNAIPRNGKHLSFPVELGVAFIGPPSLNMAFTSGQVCDAQGQNCVDVATDPDVQTNLQQQIVKYTSDLNPLRTFPIVSAGVAYSFNTRRY